MSEANENYCSPCSSRHCEHVAVAARELIQKLKKELRTNIKHFDKVVNQPDSFKRRAERAEERNRRYDAIMPMLWHDEAFIGSGEDGGWEFCVLCNDLFWWGTADGIGVPESRWLEVAEIYKKLGTRGMTAWCCRERGLLPQKPIREKPEWEKARKDFEAVYGPMELEDPGPS